MCRSERNVTIILYLDENVIIFDYVSGYTCKMYVLYDKTYCGKWELSIYKKVWS